tara:strand:+ start:26222 stop:27520 length:1299 start_codon:yes stop_codon:yes gene_type:complete
MKIHDGKLYYGSSGSVTTSSGTVSVNFAGVWDGTTNGWTTLDGGITSGYGRGLHVINDNKIYCFGNFSAIGSSNPLSYGSNFCLAEWNGTQWTSVGGTTLGNTDHEIRDVAYDSERQILYAVGRFTTIYGVSASRVASYNYNTNTWSALSGGISSTVNSCTLDSNGNLYVCGEFSGAYNGGSFLSNTRGVAKWNRTQQYWESIATGNILSSWDIFYALDTNHLYLSGSFSSVNSVPNTKLIARYHLQNQIWESIGDFTAAGDSVIYEIDYLGESNLFVSGNFISNGDDVAKFDGTTWTGHGIANGFSLNPSVGSDFTPIDMIVDGNDNIFVNRNAGGFYIKMNGDSQWNRLDQIGSNLNIITRPTINLPLSYYGSGYLYTYEELVQIGLDNGVTNSASIPILNLGTVLWKNGYVTQQMLQDRQTAYYSWMFR